jgi:hypothetical protein
VYDEAGGSRKGEEGGIRTAETGTGVRYGEKAKVASKSGVGGGYALCAKTKRVERDAGIFTLFAHREGGISDAGR